MVYSRYENSYVTIKPRPLTNQTDPLVKLTTNVNIIRKLINVWVWRHFNAESQAQNKILSNNNASVSDCRKRHDAQYLHLALVTRSYRLRKLETWLVRLWRSTRHFLIANGLCRKDFLNKLFCNQNVNWLIAIRPFRKFIFVVINSNLYRSRIWLRKFY